MSMKWKIKYSVLSEDDTSEEKETEVFAGNVFEAYMNADRILKIIERGKTIKKIEVVQH
mgnify:CR=1 FL=1